MAKTNSGSSKSTSRSLGSSKSRTSTSSAKSTGSTKNIYRNSNGSSKNTGNSSSGTRSGNSNRRVISPSRITASKPPARISPTDLRRTGLELSAPSTSASTNEPAKSLEKNKASIYLYYQGDLVDAQLIVNEMLDEFNDAAPAITDINSSIAFPGGGPDYSEVQFFRARLSENVVEFSSEDMLHIPFNKRHIVKSERFSIPGLPCLYLGNSSYACWVEMGCPADHRFNVAPILLDNTQKVLNLHRKDAL